MQHSGKQQQVNEPHKHTFKKFCLGDMSMKSEPHGQLVAATDNNQLQAITKSDPCHSVWEKAAKLDVHYLTVSTNPAA